MSYITAAQRPSYAVQKEMMFNLKHAYPFLNCGFVGSSLCSRRLLSLSLGNGKNPVVLAAGFHAQEWLTVLALYRLAELLCRSRTTGEDICGIFAAGATADREVIIIPCVNPDGVEIALNGANTALQYEQTVLKASGGDLSNWNANARGVDINHNFDAGWSILRREEIAAGITGPAPRRYGGFAPESEPETQALADLCMRVNPRRVVALHSQGEEIFWQYSDKTPEGAKETAQILAAASGYTLVENSGLASHGGFKDWFIECFEKPGFTFELGKGRNPLPLEEFEPIFSKALKMLLLSIIL